MSYISEWGVVRVETHASPAVRRMAMAGMPSLVKFSFAADSSFFRGC